VLGSRFLQLTHTGRGSGPTYDTVLEVVHHGRNTGEYVVVSGFGREADRYRKARRGGDRSGRLWRSCVHSATRYRWPS
jgi:hypothetical protein